MPELPEVEIVRQGLAPFLLNTRIKKLTLNRPNLRFEFPSRFAQKIEGATIINVGRRAKYLLFELSSGLTLLSHLGMTGNFRFFQPISPGKFEKHDHVVFELSQPKTAQNKLPAPFLVYSDPRRFGFMDLFDDIDKCTFLKDLGPEPLGNELNAQLLARRFALRRGPVKTVLLDQRVLAGLGNIYVCEALFRAGIHPAMPASELGASDFPRLEVLARQIRNVLEEALVAGGSTLKDYRNVAGQSGYFQHRFAVYDRKGQGCQKPDCEGNIERIVQSGRSSFFCPLCQII